MPFFRINYRLEILASHVYIIGIVSELKSQVNHYYYLPESILGY